jgi:predicted RNA-binding protein with PIN domain
VAIAVARVGLAADPPEPPPRGLLPLLRFARLPDQALAAARKVIDDDEGFRRRVCRATTEELVGRASWLFLDRPDGWEEELGWLAAAAEEAVGAAEETRADAKLRRRVAMLEAGLSGQADELVRLRAELALAKDQRADERRARRLAESDAGRLRRTTDELATEVDDLRRRQSVAPESPESAEEGVRPPPPALLEVESEPPPPVIDAAGLAELLAEAVRAAAALSEVLADAEAMVLPAPDAASPRLVSRARPPGPRRRSGEVERRRPTPLPPGTFDDSVEAAGHLVRVEGVRVLVDGYNVTKSARPELALSEQRRWLTDAAVELAARTGARVELVFDGADERPSAPANLGRRQGVQVRFSAEGVEADDLLLELIEGLPRHVPVVVASDDRRVRDGAERRGANVVSTAQLLTVLGRPPS